MARPASSSFWIRQPESPANRTGIGRIEAVSDVWFTIAAGLLVLGLVEIVVFSTPSTWNDQLRRMGRASYLLLIALAMVSGYLALATVRLSHVWSGWQVAIGAASSLAWLVATALFGLRLWRRS